MIRLLIICLALLASSSSALAGNPPPRPCITAKEQAFADNVWVEAQHYYPFNTGEEPSYHCTRDYVGANRLPNGMRLVFVTRLFMRQLVDHLGPTMWRGGINDARMGLVHEWAHTYQLDAVLDSRARWLPEGGAQAYAETVAPKIYGRLGMRVHPFRDEYDSYVRRVVRTRGWQWIMHDQFAGATPP